MDKHSFKMAGQSTTARKGRIKTLVAVLVAILFLCALLTEIYAQGRNKKTSSHDDEGMALSLNVLEQRVKESLKRGKSPDKELDLMGGMKKIYGFMIDRKNKDCILFGKADNDSPELHLDDFVVALRNSRLASGPPACSIDPRSENLARLQRMTKEIMAIQDPDELEEKVSLWKDAGGTQDVKVLGVKRNTSFAKTMVDADYLLKRITDGSVSLDVEGFESFTKLMTNEVKKKMEQGNMTISPMQIVMRFWFYPGKNSFEENKDIYLIKKSDVVLLTEEEFLSSTGQRMGSGKAHPMAKAFVDSFTREYKNIANAEPLYASLWSLYRMVALSRLLEYKNAAASEGHDLDYWLRHYPVKEVSVPSTLPAVSNVKKVELSTPVGYGYIYIPTSGGVSMDIKIGQQDIEKDKTNKLSELKDEILQSRPSKDSLAWRFPVEEGMLR